MPPTAAVGSGSCWLSTAIAPATAISAGKQSSAAVVPHASCTRPVAAAPAAISAECMLVAVVKIAARRCGGASRCRIEIRPTRPGPSRTPVRKISASATPRLPASGQSAPETAIATKQPPMNAAEERPERWRIKKPPTIDPAETAAHMYPEACAPAPSFAPNAGRLTYSVLQAST